MLKGHFSLRFFAAMPPRPWEQQLPGSTASSSRRSPGGKTFSDGAYHETKRGQQQPQHPSKRWSYVLQDLPAMTRAVLHDVNKGYVARVAAFLTVTAGSCYFLYRCVLLPHQQQKPLAQRSRFLSPPTPITLLEKNREEGNDIVRYRFALPHSYDYAGYEPVSSVRVISGRVRELSSLSRWYTPISHPEERGFIEFAIKDCDPGRMSARLRYLQPGDTLYLGRWMKEFDFRPDSTPELGVICSTSGASVALQLMNIMDKHQHCKTQLRVLYCHHTANQMPFKDSLFREYAERSKGRIQVSYNVLSAGRRTGGAAGARSFEGLYYGHLDPDIIAATMPPPLRMDPITDGSGKGDAATMHRPPLLICGPQSMLSPLCGRVSVVGNYAYWQGPPYRYSGFLKDMGYTRSQVYKFGVSTHFLADH